ncbi:MAG: hypothetical protein DKM22_00055 [Candidatus Melainabacteria bacterium]|nr:MAG: hypothetical protein DKM22_00055 [Candidatus Melainabacteria bacterium]
MQKFKPLLFYLTFFIFVFAFCLSASNYDYDLWARLIVGKHFFQTLSVMKTDIVSYIPTDVWYDHEWGSGVVFYFFQHLFSYKGLLFLQVSMICAIYFLISKTILLRNPKSSPYNILFYICSYFAIIQVTSQPVRCQLFSFLFFTVFIYIFEYSRKNDKSKLLWLLPLLMIIWNNLHGGCVSGLGLFVFYIVGEFLNKRPIKHYVLPFLFSIFVLLINPWGVNYLKYLLSAVTMPRPDIIEWHDLFNPLFVNRYLEFKLFALIVFSTGVFNFIKTFKKEKIDAVKYILIFATLYLAIKHVKHIPFAVIVLSIFLYDDFYAVFNLITGEVFFKRCWAVLKNIVIYSLILTYLIFAAPFNNIEPFLNWDKYPIRIVEFIRINNLKGNILTSFGQGSFVSYKLYPHNKIYMDGRYEELYFKEDFDNLQNFLMVKNDWQALMKKYPPDMMILEKDLPVCKILLIDPNWNVAFDDNNFYLFLKTNPKNLIESSRNLLYYRKHLFDTDINFVIN